jgi:dienelactone hydrolase
MEAAAVLDLVANQPVPRALHVVAHERVTTRELTLSTTNGPIRARLYTPEEHPDAPAMVVLHGVHHLGMDEPRLIAFASGIASCGLRVLTPELPGIKDYQVSADSIRTIGDSAAWMAVQNPNGERRPVGVMGLSFSGGLSLLAAADPVYRPSIKFVVAIGSQDEMGRVVQYYRTGSDARPGAAPELLPPHEYGALVMEYEHVEDFVPPADVVKIRAVLRAHLYEDAPAEKAAFAALSGVQHAEAMQLLDTTSDLTRGLLAAAESRHVQDMAGVSPHNHLGSLTTPVYLLHGAGDNIIPASETLWTAAELPGTTLQSVLISPVLSHLNLDGAQPSAMDRWRLVHFFALILRAAHAR